VSDASPATGEPVVPPLDQQVAMVTGGAGGLGSAIAAELASRGVTVVVTDVAAERAEGVAQAIRDDGGKAVAAELDVTSSSAVDALVQSIERDHGRLDIVVNSAGFPVDRPLLKMTDDDWRVVLDVCLFGTFTTSRAAAAGMVERGYGRIVNISSRAWHGNPGQANYSAAKAGVVGLTKALAKELGRHGVTVNAIAPGMIETDMVKAHPKFDAIAERAIKDNAVKRLGQPHDVAAAVAFLASPDSGFVSGDVLHVSGGRFG
jgi:3-oxoacyl-[acyl-carrier protein] reductase